MAIFFLPSRSMPLPLSISHGSSKHTIERIFSASRFKAKGTEPQTQPRPDLTVTGESKKKESNPILLNTLPFTINIKLTKSHIIKSSTSIKRSTILVFRGSLLVLGYKYEAQTLQIWPRHSHNNLKKLNKLTVIRSVGTNTLFSGVSVLH